MTIKKHMKPEDAMQKMESVCAQREQCEYDILLKLIKAGIPLDKRTEIITHLKKHKFIDNSRYARIFAKDKAELSHWGPYKIKMALASKRIKPDIIEDALKLVDDYTWEKALFKAAESKIRFLNLNSPGKDGYIERQKLFRFLIGRGFQSSDAIKTINILRKKTSPE